jgi:hypothetical protein
VPKKDNAVKKLICLLFAYVFVCGCASQLQQDAFQQNVFEADATGDFRFVVMGDSRPWGQGEDIITQNEYFLANIDRANASQADFVVNVGDLILGYTPNVELINQQWDAYDKACKRFDIPYISVIGNHDVWDEQSQQIWQRRYGPLYFSWDHKGCHFIALCSEIVGQIDEITGKQLKWLETDLGKAASARRIFVFLHKPLWRYEPAEGEKQNQWERDVHPLLAKYNVDTVFAGHWHQYILCPTMDGVRYVVTGGAGAELGDAYELAGAFFHFVTVDVAGKSSRMKVVTPKGQLASDCVTTRKIDNLEKAIYIEPMQHLPRDGNILLPIHVTNPTAQPAKAILLWDVNGTTWQVDEAETLIPAGSRETMVAKVKYQSLFPLPEARVKLVDGERVLFGWQFLGRAFSKIGRFVVDWNVVGPFDLGIKDVEADFLEVAMPGWESPLPPERIVDLGATYSGKSSNQVAWQVVQANENGYIDLNRVFNKEDDVAACAVVYVYSPTAGKYPVAVGSDDSIVVRVNGREVWRNRVLRSARPDDDTFMVELQKGWNEVLLKVVDHTGDWGFYLRIIDPDRTLQFSPVRGSQAADAGISDAERE